MMKTFKQFIKFLTESHKYTVSTVIAQAVFLINGKVYVLNGIKLDGAVTVERADRYTGFPGNAFVEDWWITDVEEVKKFADLVDSDKLLAEIRQISDNVERLTLMGLANRMPASLTRRNEIIKITRTFVNTKTLVVVESDELFNVKLILDQGKGYSDLTGEFEDDVENSFEKSLEDFEPWD